MGQKRSARNRTSGSKAKNLAPKKLGVREQDAVRGGFSWSETQTGTGRGQPADAQRGLHHSLSVLAEHRSGPRVTPLGSE